MLRPGVQHVIRKPDSGRYPNVLAGCYLGCMVGAVWWGYWGVGCGQIVVEEGIGVWKVVE